MNKFKMLKVIRDSKDPFTNYEEVREFMAHYENCKTIKEPSHSDAYNKVCKNVFNAIKKKPYLVSGKTKFYLASGTNFSDRPVCQTRKYAKQHYGEANPILITPEIAKEIATFITKGPIRFIEWGLLGELLHTGKYYEIKDMAENGELEKALKVLNNANINSALKVLNNANINSAYEISNYDSVHYLRRTKANAPLIRKLEASRIRKKMEKSIGDLKNIKEGDLYKVKFSYDYYPKPSQSIKELKHSISGAALKLIELEAMDNWTPVFKVRPLKENTVVFKEYEKNMDEEGWCEYRKIAKGDGLRCGGRIANLIYTKQIESRLVKRGGRMVREIRVLETAENVYTYD